MPGAILLVCPRGLHSLIAICNKPPPHGVELRFSSSQLLLLSFKEMVKSLNVSTRELEHDDNFPGLRHSGLGTVAFGETFWDLLPS